MPVRTQIFNQYASWRQFPEHISGCFALPTLSGYWGQEKGATEDEMVGWHHQLNEHEFEQALGDDEGQGSLVSYSPWHEVTKSRTWLSEWTELNCTFGIHLLYTISLLQIQFLQDSDCSHFLGKVKWKRVVGQITVPMTAASYRAD